jgi:hypothetical protein
MVTTKEIPKRELSLRNAEYHHAALMLGGYNKRNPKKGIESGVS